MRKLDRAVCATPQCLGTYQHGAHTWDNVQPADKAEIKAHLEAMQGKRCAYCEAGIDDRNGHIEHFRRRSVHPDRIFDWSNLYWSCSKSDSCGFYKDSKAWPYNVAELIEPCCDDPDNFFVFRSDGTISIRRGLSDQDEGRAKETLRVFSLDADWGRLRAMRKAAVSGYLNDANEAFSAGFSPDDIRAYFAEVLGQAKELPFFTAIRHVLTERQ